MRTYVNPHRAGENFEVFHDDGDWYYHDEINWMYGPFDSRHAAERHMEENSMLIALTQVNQVEAKMLEATAKPGGRERSLEALKELRTLCEMQYMHHRDLARSCTNGSPGHRTNIALARKNERFLNALDFALPRITG